MNLLCYLEVADPEFHQTFHLLLQLSLQECELRVLELRVSRLLAFVPGPICKYQPHEYDLYEKSDGVLCKMGTANSLVQCVSHGNLLRVYGVCHHLLHVVYRLGM